MTDKEKSDLYVSIHPVRALFAALRGLVLILSSIVFLFMAVGCALNRDWDKGTFFLVAMIVVDMAIGRLMEKREKDINEIIGD